MGLVCLLYSDPEETCFVLVSRGKPHLNYSVSIRLGIE